MGACIFLASFLMFLNAPQVGNLSQGSVTILSTVNFFQIIGRILDGAGKVDLFLD